MNQNTLKKKTWKPSYTFVLVSNAMYIIMFYVMMKFY